MLDFSAYIIITIYLLVLFYLGFFFSKKQKSINDYFNGGQRIPSWAAGLSIFGTVLSPITFLAIPAKTYATDWSYFIFNISILIITPIIVFFFLPTYRKLNISTAYEFLEKRFDLSIRLIGAFCFIAFQIGRIGIVLFLPSLVLNLVLDLNIFFCIMTMGFISLFYTFIGGIEAVIWTDVIQVFVLLTGIVVSVLYLFNLVDGGLFEIIKLAKGENKFNIIDFSFSLKQPTLWVVLLGGLFTNISTYGTDQTIVQRYLVTSDINKAKKSIWINAIMSVPSSIIFFFIGTALYVFYNQFPNELSQKIFMDDAIFPWFIITQLPSPVSGLLIASIFAAAMSSLSSSMNSGASSYLNDFHKRLFGKKENDLKSAKYSTLVIGFVGILFAWLLASYEIKSLWDEFNKILGLVIGSLGGVFLLGILTKKANSYGVLIGFFITVVIQIIVSYFDFIHLLLYSATGVISCFILGYIFSFIFKKS